MSRVRALWQRVTTLPATWDCPGGGCDGFFPSPERANEHAWVARTIGSHDVAPQRAFLRKRDRQARQLRRHGRTR
jgi:hypothetical protein